MSTSHLAPFQLLNQGRYRIVKPLRQGGMGSVYLAEDTLLLRQVAIKEVEEVEFALREAQALAGLAHPAIPGCFDLFIHRANKKAYVVMEYIEGVSLYEEARACNGRLPVPRVVEVGREVIVVIIYLQSQGRTHCDIKPANILRRRNGRLVLTDFGISCSFRDQGTTMRGTPRYTAPEQVLGKKVPETDLFGLGATLYALLRGVIPAEEDHKGVTEKHTTQVVFPVEVDVPPVLATLITGLLAPEPYKRPNAAATKTLLESLSSG